MRNWLGKQTIYFVLYILLSGESVSIDSRALRDTIRSSTSQGSADSDPSDTNPGNSTDTALTSTLRRYEAAKWSEESLLTADYGSAGSAAGGTAGGPLWDRDFLTYHELIEPNSALAVKVLPEQRLLVCAIPGNGASVWADLLCSLSKQHPLNARVERGRQSGFEKGCSQRSAAPLAQGVSDERDLQAIFKDDRWTRAVLFRDPLDRFLAAWQTVCPIRSTDHRNPRSTRSSSRPPRANQRQLLQWSDVRSADSGNLIGGSSMKSDFTRHSSTSFQYDGGGQRSHRSRRSSTFSADSRDYNRQRVQKGVCEVVFGHSNASFPEAVEALNQSAWRRKFNTWLNPTADSTHFADPLDPWRLQSSFCNGTLALNNLNDASIASAIDNGIAESNEASSQRQPSNFQVLPEVISSPSMNTRKRVQGEWLEYNVPLSDSVQQMWLENQGEYWAQRNKQLPKRSSKNKQQKWFERRRRLRNSNQNFMSGTALPDATPLATPASIETTANAALASQNGASSLEIISSNNNDLKSQYSFVKSLTPPTFAPSVAGSSRSHFHGRHHNGTNHLRAIFGAALEKVGIALPDSEPSFRLHFPPPPRASAGLPTLQDGGGGVPLHPSPHARALAPYSADELTCFYSSPELVRTVLRHYRADYFVFDMPVPNWAAALAGSEFLEKLGLRGAPPPDMKAKVLRNSVQHQKTGRPVNLKPHDMAPSGRIKGIEHPNSADSHAGSDSLGSPGPQRSAASQGRFNGNSAVRAAASADDDDRAVEKAKASVAAAIRASEEVQGSAWHIVNGLSWDGHADDSQKSLAGSRSAAEKWIGTGNGMVIHGTGSHHQRSSRSRRSNTWRNSGTQSSSTGATKSDERHTAVAAEVATQQEGALRANGKRRSVPSREDTLAAANAHRCNRAAQLSGLSNEEHELSAAGCRKIMKQKRNAFLNYRRPKAKRSQP